jgi:beta-galactosidase
MQSDIIRKHLKQGDFITTNGMFSSLDNHQMNIESLDFYTYDSYPNFAYCIGGDTLHAQDLNDQKWSRSLAEVRSISPERFGIMEQQSGPNGWNTAMAAPSPRPKRLEFLCFNCIINQMLFHIFAL